MDPEEYEARLVAIEQMVETLARGYLRGNHFQILGGVKKTARKDDRPSNGADGDGGDGCLDANGRINLPTPS